MTLFGMLLLGSSIFCIALGLTWDQVKQAWEDTQ